MSPNLKRNYRHTKKTNVVRNEKRDMDFLNEEGDDVTVADRAKPHRGGDKTQLNAGR